MSVEGVVVRRGGMLCRECFESPLRRGRVLWWSSDTEIDDGEGERSPPYQESNDSSSADDGDDSDGADADAGGGAGGGSGGARGVRFIGIHCTYKCTHISDYKY